MGYAVRVILGALALGGFILVSRKNSWRRRRRLVALSASALLLGTAVVPITMVDAAWEPCDTYNPNSYFAGWTSKNWMPAPPNQALTVEGAAATNMTFRFGDLCTQMSDSHNLTAAWSMVVGSDRQGWAQSGLWTYQGWSCWRFFAQQMYNRATTLPVTVWGVCLNPGNGEHHNVWQQTIHDGAWANWRIRSNIDATMFIQSSYCHLCVWRSPLDVQFMGETKMNRSDVPGYWPYPTDFSGMQVQNACQVVPYGTTCNEGSWLSSCASYLYAIHDTRYWSDSVACDHTRSWTAQRTQ
jgi:hypothetical protein